MSMPKTFDFLKERGCPELKNDFSKNVFYKNIKIIIKSLFDIKS